MRVTRSSKVPSVAVPARGTTTRGAKATVLAVVLVAAAAGCASDDGTVTLAFEPAEGAEVEYETVVESVTVTDLPGSPPVDGDRQHTARPPDTGCST